MTKVFVGSSSECLKHLKLEDFQDKLKAAIDGDCEVVYWAEDSNWKNLNGPLASITKFALQYDYAVLVGFPDDIVDSRGKQTYRARDNVIFELGFFLNCLGANRTFFARPREIQNPAMTSEFAIMSDLEGADLALYSIDQKNEMDSRKWKSNFENVIETVSKKINANEKALASFDHDSAQDRISKLTSEIREGRTDTVKLLSLGRHISELAIMKAIAKPAAVNDVVEDVGLFFKEIDDVISVEQLIDIQSADEVGEIWVYASEALEFAGKSNATLKKVLNMVTENVIKRNKRYVYFLNHDSYRHRRKDLADIIRKCAQDQGIWNSRSEKKVTENMTIVYMPKSRFFTNFTLHFGSKDATQVDAVYMSSVHNDRKKDLAYKLKDDQANRIYETISSMFLKVRDSGVPTYHLLAR